MEKWLEFTGTMILLAALAQTGIKNVRTGVLLFTLQSLALSAAGALAAIRTGYHELFFMVGLTVLIKAIAIPAVVLRVTGRAGIDQNSGSVLGLGWSLGVAVLLLFVAHKVSAHLGNAISGAWLPVAVCLLLVGLFVMVNCRHAVAQMLGFLTLENGLFLAAMALTYGMPFVVEIGVFFDLLVAALLMAVLIYRIHGSMASMDTGKLRRLRG